MYVHCTVLYTGVKWVAYIYYKLFFVVVFCSFFATKKVVGEGSPVSNLQSSRYEHKLGRNSVKFIGSFGPHGC